MSSAPPRPKRNTGRPLLQEPPGRPAGLPPEEIRARIAETIRFWREIDAIVAGWGYVMDEDADGGSPPLSAVGVPTDGVASRRKGR